MNLWDDRIATLIYNRFGAPFASKKLIKHLVNAIHEIALKNLLTVETDRNTMPFDWLDSVG